MSARNESCLNRHPSLASSEEQGIVEALLLLSKPGIVLAEVLAALAGILLAAPAPPPGTAILVLFAIAVSAGGAAMLNGILDAATDRKMARLERRCKALQTAGTGRVLIIAISLMGFGLILATMIAPPLVPFLLAVGCLSYLGLYTAWLKRRSPWGVLAGSIPGAIPPMIGAAAVSGGLNAPSLLLAVFIFIWQLPHFWLLALEYRDQYARAGIPVLPLTHGEPLTRILTLAATVLLLPVTGLLGLLGSLSTAYHSVASVAGIFFVLYCAYCLYRTRTYRQGFRASLAYLLIMFGAVSVSSFMR